MQTSRRARFENIRDAFVLASPRTIRNKRITLVDDVVTTASTLKAAADALKSAGPASISVLTIAIADPKGRQFEMI
ncbi:MAG: hypothetical protein H7144_17795 [Burkholderiales bacterium]|nr:hypothetical protein [Phycisphaerae bacterium]